MTSAPEAADAAPDGRRLRSQRNRARIVCAMLELVREGMVAPGADAVAQRAGVGLRTVFRHFRDMDSLYREMGQTVSRHIQPLIDEPVTGRHWREQLHALLLRKATLFEEVMPFYRAAKLQRQDSSYLCADAKQTAARERRALLQLLPHAVARDRELVEALDLALSFDSWLRLRLDQGLTVERSQATVQRLLDGLLGAPGQNKDR